MSDTTVTTTVKVPAEGSPVIIDPAPLPPPQRDKHPPPPEHFAMRYVTAMFMECKHGVWCVSMGRILTLIVFAHILVTWIALHDITEHELETFWGLLSYVTGSKVTDAIGKLRNRG